MQKKKQRKHEYDSTSRENYDDPLGTLIVCDDSLDWSLREPQFWHAMVMSPNELQGTAKNAEATSGDHPVRGTT